MKQRFKWIWSLAILVMTLMCFSCGSSDSNRNNKSGASSSLAQYAGKWELFQVGNSPSESATFTLTIRSNGEASISHVAHTGYSDTCLESGDGYAELNGDVLFVEIANGKSRGTTLRLIARNGRIYTADGESFSRK